MDQVDFEEYSENRPQRPINKPSMKAAGYNTMDPGNRPARRKDSTMIMLSAVIILLVAIVVLSVAFNLLPFNNPFGGITGNTVLSDEDGKFKSPTSKTTPGETEVTTIKNIKLGAAMECEEFSVPIDSLDMAIMAKQVQIITPSADITVDLEKPTTFEKFSGNLVWKDSMLVLEGKLNKYMSEALNINWKTNENVKIKINSGSVAISQMTIIDFDTVATGEISMADKAVLKPSQDNLELDYYRGSFKVDVDGNMAKVTLDGSAEDMTLGSELFSFNIK